jgi:hypothetical protein
MTSRDASDVTHREASDTTSRHASDITRRDMLGLMATIPLATALGGIDQAVERAARAARHALGVEAATGVAFAPEFFTPHEWSTVRLLVDLIIPRDARSGSATDAGVPEFMDFTMVDRPGDRQRMRDGLKWLDDETTRRSGKTFVGATDAQRKAVLDAIAWPDRAAPAVREGVDFFNRFRDLTATGFFSSEMGVKDLRYIGNVPNPAWNGCPPEALRKLGVSYEEWDSR